MNDALLREDLHREIHEFATTRLYGTPTRDQYSRFEQLCRENPEACRIYAEFVFQAAAIRSLVTDASEEAGDHAESKSSVGPNVNSVIELSNSARSKAWTQRLVHHDIGVSLAVACVSLAVLVFWSATTPVSFFKSSDTDDQAGANGAEIATFDAARNAVWAPGRELEESQRIRAGQLLMLRSGFVVVTYDTGARIVLEGPAKYVVGNQDGANNSGYLSRGKVVVRIENEEAKHFTLETPSARIEDLSTEFSVEVERSGDSYLHVCEGKVRLGGTQGLARRVVSEGSFLHVGVDQSGVSAASTVAPFEDRFSRAAAVLRQNSAEPDAVLYPKWDTYVTNVRPDEDLGDSEILLVKRMAASDEWDREAWLCFDLSSVDTSRLVDAMLSLTTAQGKGNESDASIKSWQFEVLGISGSAAVAETASDVTWHATRDAQAEVLATFRLTAAAPPGSEVWASGADFVRFLKESKNQFAVLAIRRVTAVDTPNVANGFSSMDGKERGNGAPALRLWYRE